MGGVDGGGQGQGRGGGGIRTRSREMVTQQSEQSSMQYTDVKGDVSTRSSSCSVVGDEDSTGIIKTRVRGTCDAPLP